MSTKYYCGLIFFLQNVNGVLEGRILLQVCADGLDTMQDGSVVAATQCLADILQAGFGHGAAQIHDNLAWINNFLAALCGHDVKWGKVKMIGNDLDDEFGVTSCLSPGAMMSFSAFSASSMSISRFSPAWKGQRSW